MNDYRNERDEDGELTDMALAMDALVDLGCDCGVDEPGTCLACICERALRAERAEAEKLRRLVNALDSLAGMGMIVPGNGKVTP